MNKNIFYTIFISFVGVILALWLVMNKQDHDDMGHDDHHHEENEEVEKGPKGGRLLKQGDFALEITLFEKGVPPEFHLYSYYAGEAINPDEVSVVIKLSRLDGQVDTFNFRAQNNYLLGDGVVTEPHSFDVSVNATYKDKQYQWQYENYEGRVQIGKDIAIASGIKTDLATAKTIHETLKLTGRIEVDPNRLSQVRARFPGVVKKVKRELGEQVQKDDVLAEIQSNESLQTYQLIAPINGIIVQRDIQPGENTGETPLFIIADLSTVWAELDVFNKDIARVQKGHHVTLETLDGSQIEGKISWLSPMIAHASQSIQARVVLANSTLTFKPGQFIRGQVTVAEHKVELAVKQSAIQSFRDFQVVFAKVNDTYEVRMLELGRQDNEWIEVLGGLKPGTEYVTENSYLIKADIEKSGASHDH